MLHGIAIAGALFLVVLRLLPGDGERGNGTPVAAFLVGLHIGVLAIGMGASGFGLVQRAESITYLRDNLNEVERLAPGVANVVYIEGGSSAARGVAPATLESVLNQAGYPTRVINFAEPGANHFARLRKLQLARQHLPPDSRAQLENANTVLLCEAYRGYDASPLALFPNNLWSDNSLAYMHPRLAPSMARAMLDASKWGDNTATFPVAWEALRHVAANLYHAGLVDRMVPMNSVKPAPTRFQLESGDRARETFTGMDGVRDHLERTRPGDEVLPFTWVRGITHAKREALPGEAALAFFTLPTQYADCAYYAERFTAMFPADTGVCLSWAGNRKLVDSLDNVSMWYDRTHLSAAGAEQATRWLAQALIDSGLLRRAGAKTSGAVLQGAQGEA